MFNFLKKKVKNAVDSFTTKAQEEAQEVSEQELSQEEKQALEKEQLSAQELLDQTDSSQDILQSSKTTSSQQEKTIQEAPEALVEQEVKQAGKQPSPPVSIADSASSKKESSQLGSKKTEDDTGDQGATSQEWLNEQKAPSLHDEDEVNDLSDELSGTDQPQKKGFLSRVFSKKKNVDESLKKNIDEKDNEPQDISDTTISSQEKDKQKDDGSSQLDAAALQEATTSLHPRPKSAKKEISKKDASKTTVAQEKEQEVNKEAVHEELLSQDLKDVTKKKKGLFKKLKEKVVKFSLTDEAFEELFWEFELALLENNVAVEVIEKIKKDLYEQLTSQNVSRRGIQEIILQTLRSSLEQILDIPSRDILQEAKEKKPFVMCVVGVNGSGKTTTIGKIIRYLKDHDLSVVVAASDTFRAAAIQQLEQHTTALDTKLIKHDYNADPSAVAFDAIKHAKAQGIDVVLIDTAGRLQSNSNLMDELKKLVRVNKPDFTLFVGESITGNDCVQQALAFNQAVGIDGVVLSKADVDDKGGAALSVSYVTKKPILFLGVGQRYEDLIPFDKEVILGSLEL